MYITIFDNKMDNIDDILMTYLMIQLLYDNERHLNQYTNIRSDENWLFCITFDTSPLIEQY